MTDVAPQTDRAPSATGARRRWPATATAAAALVAALAACTTAGPPPPQAGCEAGAPPSAIPASGPWAGKLCRQASQKPPASVNGVLYRDGVLWIASLNGGELIAADPADGTIIGRFGPAQGVNVAPDDLAMAEDGSIYWTGQSNGDIGVLSPTDGRSRKLANIGQAVNPIAFGPDGQLYIGHAYLAKGLVRMDPATGQSTVINPNLATNGFSFGPDGQLYAPATDTIPGRLLRIDPSTGRSTIVARNAAGLGASSAKVPPPSRGEPASTVYVLSATLPAAVNKIDTATGRKTGSIPTPFLVADNMTFAPDGTLYVTGFTTPSVAVIGADGRSRTVPVGKT